MAHVNGTYRHEDYDISIDVLEPVKEESDFDEGLKIDVDWSRFQDFTPSQLREVLKWINERLEYIEKSFTKAGKPKKANGQKEKSK